MKQLTIGIPRKLVTQLDDRLLEAGALAVNMTPPQDAQPDDVFLTIYVEARALDAVKACLNKQLRALRSSEREAIMRRGIVAEVDDSWQSRWSEGLEPVSLVPGLVLVPEGVPYEPRAGERLMVLEKSLVFGFGEHPTTLMMSAWLAPRAPHKTVLDVGCGSGVLAFVAAHHHARSVMGIDIDSLSVAAATRNAQRNGWLDVCRFEGTPVEAVVQQFEVVVANVDALTLERLSKAIARTLAVGGALALTGVLEEQAQAVADAFDTHGVRLHVCDRSDGWVLLTS